MRAEETIAAVSTPFGEGGIGIVRVSGDRAIEVVDGIFRGKTSVGQMEDRRVYYGWIVGEGREIDEVLVWVMRGPRSFTGEDVVEINGHGGVLVLRKMLREALRHGARLAERGEFTRRAFLNGKLDLVQAEAVVDLIEAKSDGALRAAYRQLQGGLSDRMWEVKEGIADGLALMEASLEFDEDEVEIDGGEVGERMRKAEEEVSRLLDSFRFGKILREGIDVVILGKPNVGKSSLLNLLLGEDRAIVTEIPGTTRDMIEERAEIGEMAFNLVDTAGVREHSSDLIEQEGMRRARARCAAADAAVVVLDAAGEMDREDRAVFEMAKMRRKVVVLNKCDLEQRIDLEAVRSAADGAPVVEMSALEGWGTEDLRGAIAGLFSDIGPTAAEAEMVTKERHVDCLRRTGNALRLAEEALRTGLSYEYVAFDLREALDAMGEMLGDTTTEEILDRIFERFCIGK